MSGAPGAPVIIWFRQDLRLCDNAALSAAASAGRPLLPCYVLDDGTPGPWRAGGASRWWLHGSLAALAGDLRREGGRLVLRRGETQSELLRLAAETGAGAIYWSRGYEPGQVALEQRLRAGCDALGIQARRFAGSLLFEPETLSTGAGKPFRVFTPFWKACLARPGPADPLPRPAGVAWFDRPLASDDLERWGLRPRSPDWAAGLRESWRPGEAGAHERLAAFLEDDVGDYREGRDRPDRSSTSRLSPYLHHGEISPRQVWRIAHERGASAPGAEGTMAFLREIGWREFSYHLLFHWPSLPEQPFRPQFAAFPWRDDAAALEAWQRGRTGYPVVDAGMRELWHTGWMHNRVRMVAASLLVKHLLVPWQAGARWFWDTLVDADLASNSASWQWVAGSGADAAPYFRIFNPELQGKKFDPAGHYVRRWVPELRALPVEHVHAPWRAPAAVREHAGGARYPAPLVEHRAARERALAAYARIRQPGGAAG